jgi:Family of unknown function (DUF6444)
LLCSPSLSSRINGRLARTEAQVIYDAGREAGVKVLLAMDRRIRPLEARVKKLERELAKSSCNSSLPPSADPPVTRPPARARIVQDALSVPSRAASREPRALCAARLRCE